MLNREFYAYIHDPNTHWISHLHITDSPLLLVLLEKNFKNSTHTYEFSLKSPNLEFYKELESYLTVQKNFISMTTLIIHSSFKHDLIIKLFSKYQSHRLAHIIITSDDNDQVDLKLKTIQYMGRECVNLQTFNCAHIWGIPISGLEFLSNIQSLKNLKISTANMLVSEFNGIFKDNFRNLEFLGISNFRDALVDESKAEFLRVISKLNIKHLELDWEMTNFKDGLLLKDIRFFKNVKNLTLRVPIEAYLDIEDGGIPKTQITASSHSFTQVTFREAKIRFPFEIDGNLEKVEYFNILQDLINEGRHHGINVYVYCSF